VELTLAVGSRQTVQTCVPSSHATRGNIDLNPMGER